MIYNWGRPNCNRQLAVEGGMKKSIGGAPGVVASAQDNLFDHRMEILAALEPTFARLFSRRRRKRDDETGLPALRFS
jgi:hypothetical protein